MPLSSASIRATLTLSLLAAFLSCASAPPSPGLPVSGAAEGTIRISGNHPYDRQIVLMGEDGRYYLLHTAALQGELLALDGQMVRAHGRIGSTAGGTEELSVEWYELLAADGGFAAVGTLGVEGEELVLRCGRGDGSAAPIEVLIEGPLRESIGHYAGNRVWIRGERVSAGGDSPDPSGVIGGFDRFRVIVSEYGVLGPAIPPLDAPHSTLPDSSR